MVSFRIFSLSLVSRSFTTTWLALKWFLFSLFGNHCASSAWGFTRPAVPESYSCQLSAQRKAASSFSPPKLASGCSPCLSVLCVSWSLFSVIFNLLKIAMRNWYVHRKCIQDRKKLLWEVNALCVPSSESKFYLAAVLSGSPSKTPTHTASPQLVLCFQKKKKTNVKEIRSTEWLTVINCQVRNENFKGSPEPTAEKGNFFSVL